VQITLHSTTFFRRKNINIGAGTNFQNLGKKSKNSNSI
jgi:hypothetical protein